MSSSKLLRLLVVAALVAACRPDTRQRDDGDGSVDEDSGWPPRDSGPDNDGGQGDTGTSSNCVEEARWVYVVGSGNNFLRFYPDELRFESIGTLSCPSGGNTPFSMSVDRNALAWVLHQDGRMYHVSTTDASCEATDFAPNQEGLELFGMGFATLSEGSEDETLFIAGGAEASIASGSSTLGSIDTGTLAVSTIGTIPGWPELTGNGRGELWGFFPDTSPPSVRQIDKESGDTIQTFDLQPLQGITPSAWAFAFWGGRFYIFLQRAMDLSTHVWRLDPDTGDVEDVLPNTGYRIVGAGVSTCAPVELY